jgi:integrase
MATAKHTLQLTDKVAKEAPTPEAVDYYIVYDGGHKKAVSGFGLLITRNNARSWVLRYRHNRRSRRYNIGAPPSWDAETARTRAAELVRLVDMGRDPQGEKEAERQAPIVNELLDYYLAEYATKKRTGEQDRRMIDRYVRPVLGTHRVVDVEFSDIDRLHRKRTKAGGPYAANRLHSLLNKAFSLAVLRKWRTDNPCRGIQRNEEHPRENYLDGDKLDRLTKVLAVYPDRRAANIVKLALLTGARRGELFAARWDQIDIEQGLWIKPSSHTKTKRTHRLQLSAPARLLLAEMKSTARSDYLFPGKGTDHVTDIKKAWAAICRTAEIEGTRFHDLRHTHASLLRDGGADLLTIGTLLGHTQQQTTRRYTHLFDDKLRAATERVGAVLAGDRSADVVDLRKGRG